MTSSGLVTSTSLWEKVYWFDVDYLLVAKSAIVRLWLLLYCLSLC
ncbi:hypothetical protein OROMI_034635 [Orobanche minor]